MVPAQTSEAMRYVKVPLVAGSRFKMFGVRCFRAPNATVTIFIKVFGKFHLFFRGISKFR